MMNRNRNSPRNSQPFCGTKCCGTAPRNRTTRTREKRAWRKDVATF